MKLPTFMRPATARILGNIGDLRQTREFRWAKKAVVVQFVIGIIAIGIVWRSLPPKIPLWYSKPWGDDRLTSPFLLALPIFSALLVYVVNLMLVSRTAREHPMFARILFMTSFVTSMLSMVTVIRIIMLMN